MPNAWLLMAVHWCSHRTYTWRCLLLQEVDTSFSYSIIAYCWYKLMPWHNGINVLQVDVYMSADNSVIWNIGTSDYSLQFLCLSQQWRLTYSLLQSCGTLAHLIASDEISFLQIIGTFHWRVNSGIWYFNAEELEPWHIWFLTASSVFGHCLLQFRCWVNLLTALSCDSAPLALSICYLHGSMLVWSLSCCSRSMLVWSLSCCSRSTHVWHLASIFTVSVFPHFPKMETW